MSRYLLAGLLLVIAVLIFGALVLIGSFAFERYWRREEARCQREYADLLHELTEFARAAMWEGKRRLGSPEQKAKYAAIEERMKVLVARKAKAMRMRGTAPEREA